MKYFEEVVLPSVGLPLKPSYNLKESCEILCCRYESLTLLAKKGLIRITLGKRVYSGELARFFSNKHKDFDKE